MGSQKETRTAEVIVSPCATLGRAGRATPRTPGEQSQELATLATITPLLGPSRGLRRTGNGLRMRGVEPCLPCSFLCEIQNPVRASVSGSEPRSLARPPSEQSEGGGTFRSVAEGA